MANVYVRSGAGGAGTGADWANAFTTLAAAASAKAAGDVFWVSEDHNESTAGAVTITFPGTNANPNFVYCVNHSGSVPPISADLRTTGQVKTTGNNSLSFNGSIYCYGLIFTAGDSTGTANLNPSLANSSTQIFEACSFRLGGSGASSKIVVGASSAGGPTLTRFVNTTVQFGATAQGFQVVGSFEWRNTASAIGGSLPTTLVSWKAGWGGDAYLEGVDLSALGSGKTLLDTSTLVDGAFCMVKDCKLGASVTLCSTPAGPGYPQIFLIRSDSAATNYRCEKYDYTGTETTETSIVRTGGATDGTTPQSRKIVTTANSRWVLPFFALPIAIWVPNTNQHTATIEGTWNSAAVPNNDDIWIDVEYLGASGTPLGSFATCTKADNLATGSALTSSSEAWGGGGSGAGWSPFKLSVTFTPQMAGHIYVYVKAAKASTTFYIDPKITVT